MPLVHEDISVHLTDTEYNLKVWLVLYGLTFTVNYTYDTVKDGRK